MFIFFACIFSLIALLIAWKGHDRFDPARYFLAIWGVQILFIYMLFHNQFRFTGYGLVVIIMFCLIFSIGTFLGQHIGNYLPNKSTIKEFQSKTAFLLLSVSIVLGLVFVWIGIHSFGYNIKQILSFRLLLELNNAASVSRYNEESSNGITTQILLVFIYLSPLLGGYLLPLFKGKNKILCYLSIVPSLLLTLTQSIKAGFITSIALWGVGVLVSSYTHDVSFFKIQKATVLKIGLAVVLFFGILFSSMVFRTGTFDNETVQLIGDKISIYAFGHLPAFDLWFTNNFGQLDHTFGVKTFYGISNFLGIGERKIGIFTDFTQFAKNNLQQIPPELETNVYTLFRLLIEDFGFLGSFLFFLVLGAISGYSLMAVRKQNSIFFQVILISILFFIAWSFVASVWAYTSYLVTLVAIYFSLKIIFPTACTEQYEE